MAGLLLGMIAAWWTAYQDARLLRGVTRIEMEEYVRDYSPYVIDKGVLNERNNQQDRDIARILATQQDVLRRVGDLEKFCETLGKMKQ